MSAESARRIVVGGAGSHAAAAQGVDVLDPPATTLVGEWDACTDGSGRHLLKRSDWEAVVRSGELGAVTGAFALAWLDPGGALHLARDAIGERSLFYASTPEGLTFASTVRDLLAAGVPAYLDTGAVSAYLAYGYIPGRRTLVEGISELLPGEHVEVRDGELRRGRLWSGPPEDAAPDTDRRYSEELRGILERAVTRRLPDDGPVAVTLSGGIDSSLVLALAGRLHIGDVTAHSLSFGRTAPNELAYARLVALHCGVDHHIVDLSAKRVIEGFDASIGALSKPIGEPLTVANTLLFERTASSARVVLNGEGGDPCFGGPKNVPMLLREIYGPGALEQPEGHLERSYLRAHRKCFDELARAVDTPPGELEAELFDHLHDERWPTLVNRLTALNVTFKGAHHILAKVDHLSRASGAVARSPLFDRDVVDAALRMPAQLKLNGRVEKYVLKQAVEDIVPRLIRDRRKSGMRVPVEAWLTGRRFDRFARERILDGLAPRGLFRRDYLESLVRPGEHPPPRRGAKIWLLLSLEAWLRVVLDGARPLPRNGHQPPTHPDSRP